MDHSARIVLSSQFFTTKQHCSEGDNRSSRREAMDWLNCIWSLWRWQRWMLFNWFLHPHPLVNSRGVKQKNRTCDNIYKTVIIKMGER